ncbi:MAG: ABC transporter permease, partial [Oscillospiraceae bacterium]
MKNKLLLDFFREIKHTFSRFLSILLLSALAVAFLSGLRITQPDMERTADDYFDAQNLMDLHVMSTLGLDDGDISALAIQPGVVLAEGGWTVDALVASADNDTIVKVHSISKNGMNAPELLEGRLPENISECVAEPKFLQASGLNIGDRVTLDTGKDAFEDALKRQTYTLVGTVNSPLYLYNAQRGTSSLGSGKVSAFLLLPEEAFDMDYTDAYLQMEGGAVLDCYSDEYEDFIDARIDQLEPLGDLRAPLRYDSVITTANKKLADAQIELDDAQRDAEQELSDAEKELTDARKELDDGWIEYKDGLVTLRTETADANKKIADATVDLADAKKTLAENEIKYQDGVVDLADGKKTLEKAAADLEQGKLDYADGMKTIAEKEQEFADGEEKYQEGMADYAIGKKDYEDGVEAYNQAAIDLADAKKQLDQGGDSLSAGSANFNAQVTPITGLVNGMLISQNPSAVPLNNDQTVDYLASLLQPGMEAYLAGFCVAVGKSEPEVRDMIGKLVAGRDALNAGSSQYSAGYSQYMIGKAEWEESGPKLEKARKELLAASLELSDAKVTLESGRRQLEDGKRDLAVAAATIADGEKDYKQGLIDWDEAQIELIDARKKLDDGKIEYADGVKELADAKIELRDETAKAQKKLTDAKIDLDDGEKEYADGVIEYNDGKAEAEEKIGDAKKKLNDARRKIADMEDCDWYILGRKTNAGFVSYQSDAQRIGNLAAVFPIIFFLVAALVCLTTMTRMVEEQRVQIGGMKALGYSKQAIAFKYVGYGFTASLIGGLCGLALGLTIIPTIIFNAWRTLYTLPDMVFAPALGLSVVSISAAVVTITGAALAASIAALAAVPAQLMRPKAPAIGKRVLLERITPLWKRLNFSLKVAVRNLFRYKKRFWMTVIGIGGCTALIIVGFGLRDSISGVVPKQFEELYHYESQVGMVDDATPEEQADLLKALEKDPHIDAYLPHYQKNVTVETDKKSVDATLMAFDDPAAVGDFITLRDRLSHEPVSLGTTGAVLTEKTAALLHVELGDTFTLDDGDHLYTLTVSGITENYVLHYIYVEKGYYETLTGEDCATNSVLCRYAQGTRADE